MRWPPVNFLSVNLIKKLLVKMCLWVCYQSVTCFTGERGLELCVEGPAVTDDDSIEMKFIITKAKKA